MKRPKATAERWIEQAEHFLRSAERDVQEAPSNACFYSEQAAQAALKAYLYFQGERFIYIHSIMELAEKCKEFDEEFGRVIKYGQRLDRYYLTTRYPDAVAPGAVPYKLFDPPEAKEAVNYAQEIVNIVKKKIR